MQVRLQQRQDRKKKLKCAWTGTSLHYDTCFFSWNFSSLSVKLSIPWNRLKPAEWIMECQKTTMRVYSPTFTLMISVYNFFSLKHQLNARLNIHVSLFIWGYLRNYFVSQVKTFLLRRNSSWLCLYNSFKNSLFLFEL